MHKVHYVGIPWFKDEQLLNKVHRGGADVSKQVMRKVEVHRGDVTERLVFILASEGGACGQHDVGEDAERPHVRVKTKGVVV